MAERWRRRRHRLGDPVLEQLAHLGGGGRGGDAPLEVIPPSAGSRRTPAAAPAAAAGGGIASPRLARRARSMPFISLPTASSISSASSRS